MDIPLLDVDETPVKKANTIVAHIRVPATLEQFYKDRGDALGIPYTTLMRRVLEAYQKAVPIDE